MLADQEDSGYYGSESSSTDSTLVLGGLQEELAMHIISETLKGLHFIHSQKVIHRDVKG